MSQICKRCVMDASASNIVFDERGYCNFCTDFIGRHSSHLKKQKDQLPELLEAIKKGGKNKSYDCIVGVSGGVDSSYALHLAKDNGLRPLAVHMDNGWDSELASNNIANLVKRADVDLYTHVIDWGEYRDLMESFFKAHVLDIELLYDNAMLAVNFQLAEKYKIKYLLFGLNSATEGIRMPQGWNWFKFDARNIRAIQKKFGTLKIKTMPIISSLSYKYQQKIKGVKVVGFLDYFDYSKAGALALLQERYGYKPYPYKHYESIFTRFYQGYILPEKFNVDKRRLHLSTLIVTGQMERSEAMEMLKKIPYPSQRELDDDIEYFLKKMKWSKERLDEYISKPGVPHDAYDSERDQYKKLGELYVRGKKILKL